MDHPPTNDRRSWCELRAHDRIIRYRCSGAGRSVLVLGAPDVSPFWAVLLAGLDGRFRVIAPETPPEDTDLAAWLASLLEGLGTSTVRVIAGDRFHAPTLEISRGEPDQVQCVVLVSEAGPPFVDAQVPVLVVAPREPGEIVGARVRDFLLREGAGSTA